LCHCDILYYVMAMHIYTVIETMCG
jgi:hypothetical protein